MTLAQFFRLFFRVRDENVLQVAEILRSCHVAGFGRLVAIEIPQFHGLPEACAKTEIRIAMLGAPYYRLGAKHAGNPDGRARLLIRSDPRIDEAVVEML